MTEELPRTADGLIQAPASVVADQKRRQEQEEALGEMRTWLTEQHREALEENSLAPFKYRLPLEALKAIPERDAEQLRNFEEQAYTRLKSIAETKELRKRTHLAAGGDAAAFEAQWAQGGENAIIADRADDLRRRAEASSPY